MALNASNAWDKWNTLESSRTKVLGQRRSKPGTPRVKCIFLWNPAVNVEISMFLKTRFLKVNGQKMKPLHIHILLDLIALKLDIY